MLLIKRILTWMFSFPHSFLCVKDSYIKWFHTVFYFLDRLSCGDVALFTLSGGIISLSQLRLFWRVKQRIFLSDAEQ